MPPYLSLCIKTWKLNLPAKYKIAILNYSNIQDYLSSEILNLILCKDMSFVAQVDAIRIALLNKYGGFWMDADTVIINSNIMDILYDYDSDLVIFSYSKLAKHFTGFIYASRNSRIVKTWLECIISRVKIYKKYLLLKRKFPIKNFTKSFNKLRIWSYLSNGILDGLVKNVSEKEFKSIEIEDSFALPEQVLLKGDRIKCYINFYFSSKYNMSWLKNCKGVLLLHNSWTPERFKKMNEAQFMRQDIMLAHLLSKILNSKN
jgi:mannosyltransferase OCH1-like enzyme